MHANKIIIRYISEYIYCPRWWMPTLKNFQPCFGILYSKDIRAETPNCHRQRSLPWIIRILSTQLIYTDLWPRSEVTIGSSDLMVQGWIWYHGTMHQGIKGYHLRCLVRGHEWPLGLWKTSKLLTLKDQTLAGMTQIWAILGQDECVIANRNKRDCSRYGMV